MKHSPNVTKFGLWLRAGIISTGIVAAAVLQLIDGQGEAVQTAVVGLLAAIAAVWSWRRARYLLNAFDDAPTAMKLQAKPASIRVRELPKNFTVPMPERP
jgi:hypothetical protein